MLKVVDLRTEYLEEPLGIDAAQPRFSWRLEAEERGILQRSYHIVVCEEDTVLWDSGIVESGESIAILYAGTPLKSRQQLTWSVTVTAQDETGTQLQALSPAAHFEMGLLRREDWQATWIEAEDEVDPDAEKPAILLKKQFSVKAGLCKARIYQTAHGLYHFWLNGTSGTDELFKPGLTSYYHRLQYQVYDILSLLHEGENTWDVTLADGWWRGVTGGTVRNNFGYKLAFLGQIELFYKDGSKEIICSDPSFSWSTGALVASDMMMGDVYDARLCPKTWHPVHPILVETRLIASAGVPVRAKERFTPTILTDSKGQTVLDFGQNIAGFVQMRLRNTKKGQLVRLTHGEGLKDGAFSVENISDTALKLPRFQEVHYLCRGGDEERYCPLFSIFGFRYVRVEGYADICPEDFTALAVYSDMKQTGQFSCSDPRIDRLFQNCLWSQKGNFMDVPVDCPTRERNAWTGDAQVYVRTAGILMDVYPFFEKWMQDQTLEQYQSGKVGITFPSTSSPHQRSELERMQKTNPLTALAGPEGNGSIGEDAVGWGDSAVWIPYMLYLSYGDKRILENQYETARRWLEFEIACAKQHNPRYQRCRQYHHIGADGVVDGEYLYDTNFQYGEWNEPIEKTPEEQQAFLQKLLRAKQEGKHLLEILAEEGKPEVATAYFYRSAKTVAHMARILNKNADAAKYEELAKRIHDMYCTYMIGAHGAIEKGHQAPYVRALRFGLYRDEKQKSQLLRHLIREIHENGDCLNTGFLSTPFLLPVLVENGQTELAYRLLEQTKSPSWLHAVELGATTIPEEWTGLDRFRASFNHYSYGAVCEFLFAHIAGIRPIMDCPGYRSFYLQPIPGGSLTHAQASYESRYGTIRSEWRIIGKTFYYLCEIPANTKAKLCLPDGKTHILLSGIHQFEVPLP